MGRMKEHEMTTKESCSETYEWSQETLEWDANNALNKIQDDLEKSLSRLGKEILDINKSKGFWDEAIVPVPFISETGETLYDEGFFPEKRNFGEAIALVHSELSEALEAHRKDLNDSHLPQYKGWKVEFADAVIRILDMYEGYNMDDVPLAQVIRAKVEYNKSRPHKHGKKY